MDAQSEGPFERLSEALAAWEQRVVDERSGSEESDEEFLARHEALRDLLEPMMEGAPSQGLAEELVGAGEPGIQDPFDPEGFGPYHVIRQIGSGGMGEVYLAEQREPVVRRVALKVIKLGMDTRQVLARFEIERQALALMNHDSIAKVFDAGTTPRGQPYFVMEYVAGRSITLHCDEMRLGTAERLALFREVCFGIQHAHQKGIIHRDLKPSNILVAVDQGRAVPKIIDFGLARATAGNLGTDSLITGHGQAIGTPQYMSPEQAELSSDGIDTRTDIYSLGVTLYELLIGRPPWTPDEVAPTPDPRSWRRMFDADPQKPSTKLSSPGSDSQRCAELRRTSARSLVRELRGDLDWIVMRALDRDRNRRYNSAAEFAADIERHLRNEPVLAGPPQLGYRLSKFVQRNRWQVAAALLLLVTLVGGVIGTGIGFVEASDRARDAERLKRDAEEWLDRYNLLAIGPLLTKASREARELHPPTPVIEPLIRRWLSDYGEPFDRRLASVRAALAKLRAAAPERTEEEVRRDREDHPVAASIRELTKVIFGIDQQIEALQKSDPNGELELVQERARSSRKRLNEYRRVQNERRTWRLADDTRQFLHDSLMELHEQLEDFAKRDLAQVRELQQWVAAVEQQTVVEFEKEWQRSIDGIRSSKEYGGLTIAPQAGLVPIGQDPQSGYFEFVHVRSGTPGQAIPVRDAEPGKLAFGRHSGIVFVLLPGAVATIGAQRVDPDQPHYDGQAAPDESPVHEVHLGPFLMSKFELTMAQWKRLSHGDEPSGYNAGAALIKRFRIRWTHPVENVSWRQCDELLRREGLVLPTEARWEYACRAGSDRVFWTGDAVASLEGHANLSDRTVPRYAPWAHETALEDGHLIHAPVGSFSANGFGIHDMHGNVYEWCLEPKMSYTVAAREGDGLRAAPGGPNKVNRGGSYQGRALTVRASARNTYPTDHRSYIVGVRPAREIAK